MNFKLLFAVAFITISSLSFGQKSVIKARQAFVSERFDEATELHKQIENEATLDNHLFDQILPYMVLSEKTSNCRVSTMSNHAQTTMWLLKQFFDVDFDIAAEETYVDVAVKKT